MRKNNLWKINHNSVPCAGIEISSKASKPKDLGKKWRKIETDSHISTEGNNAWVFIHCASILLLVAVVHRH